MFAILVLELDSREKIIPQGRKYLGERTNKYNLIHTPLLVSKVICQLFSDKILNCTPCIM